MAALLLLNGPNLNLLGRREPEHYGKITLAEIEQQTQAKAQELGHTLHYAQSNAEHILIEQIHAAINKVDFILFNPAAFTHTSIALRDALLAVEIPFIEIHLSDVMAREPFRHLSYFSDIAVEVISGLGAAGYTIAVETAHHYLLNKQV